MRAVAVTLAGHVRDHQLIQEMKRLFKQEKIWSVRQKVLEAVGKMKIASLRPELEAVIASEESLPSEKAKAIVSLLEVVDGINRAEIERLGTSNRSGLRQLACRAVVHYQSLRDLDRLFDLARDSHPDVRLEAIQAIGQLRPEKQNEVIQMARRSLRDPNCQVAASAAWLMTLYHPEEGGRAFERQLYDHRPEVRVLAAAASSATGRYGAPLATQQMQQHPDPYVRLNLAIGLIDVRQSVDEAVSHLSQMLLSEKENWYTWDVGLFHVIMNKP